MRRVVRTVRRVLRDESLPRPLRVVAGFGLLPIPGPVDEVALVLALAILAAFYRPRLIDAWNQERHAPPAPGGCVAKRRCEHGEPLDSCGVTH